MAISFMPIERQSRIFKAVRAAARDFPGKLESACGRTTGDFNSVSMDSIKVNISKGCTNLSVGQVHNFL